MNTDKRKIVCIGDIHGCPDELDEMLNVLNYNSSQIRLVFLGDILDRGENSAGCLRRVQELNVECVKGNHEDKHVRFHNHQMNEKKTGQKNPMKLKHDYDQRDHLTFSEKDFEWMEKLPTKIHLIDNWWAIHAGCEPGLDFDKQIDSQLMRVRYVDKKGRAKATEKDFKQPSNTVFWTEAWGGNQSIVYGHVIHKDNKVRIDKNLTNTCIGIDTGCVFGGSLTAWLFDPIDKTYDFVSVPAKKTYFKKGG